MEDIDPLTELSKPDFIWLTQTLDNVEKGIFVHDEDDDNRNTDEEDSQNTDEEDNKNTDEVQKKKYRQNAIRRWREKRDRAKRDPQRAYLKRAKSVPRVNAAYKRERHKGRFKPSEYQFFTVEEFKRREQLKQYTIYHTCSDIVNKY